MQRQRSWLLKRQGAQQQTKANNLVGPQRLKIGGEANGEVEVGVGSEADVRWALVDEKLLVVDVDAVEEEMRQQAL